MFSPQKISKNLKGGGGLKSDSYDPSRLVSQPQNQDSTLFRCEPNTRLR